MESRHTLAFFLLGIGFLFAGWLVKSASLWGVVGNVTVPWLCSALALSVLSLGTVCLILQVPPSQVSPLVTIVVVGGLALVLGAGMIVDGRTYELKVDTVAVLAEWAGFVLVLWAVFALGRSRRSGS